MDECFAYDDQRRKHGNINRWGRRCSDSNSNAWRNGLHHSEPLYGDDPSLDYPYGCHESSPASPPLPGGYRSPRLSNSYGAFAVMFVAQYDDRVSSILRCSVSGSCQGVAKPSTGLGFHLSQNTIAPRRIAVIDRYSVLRIDKGSNCGRIITLRTGVRMKVCFGATTSNGDK